MKIDLMIDIECLSTNYNAAIIQIGWCQFDPDDHYTGLPVTHNVQLASVLKLGFQVQAATIKWWMKQDDEARALFGAHGEPIGRVLAWLSTAAKDCECVWACPPQFDLSILKNAYFVACGGAQPWPHRQERCLRTLCDIVGYDRRGLGPHAEVRHDAGHDAYAQAQQCQNAFRMLRGEEAFAHP